MLKVSTETKDLKSTATDRVTLYPYPPGNITTRQAVDLIAAVVHPDENPIAARKRVRERIRYAREKGVVTKSNSFDALEFFYWALERPEWRALAQVEGLPRKPGKGRFTLPALTVKGYGASPPDNPQELRDECIRIEVERMKLVEEVAELKSRIAELEAEVDRWREKGRSLLAKASEVGKMGGRGNTL